MPARFVVCRCALDGKPAYAACEVCHDRRRVQIANARAAAAEAEGRPQFAELWRTFGAGCAKAGER